MWFWFCFWMAAGKWNWIWLRACGILCRDTQMCQIYCASCNVAIFGLIFLFFEGKKSFNQLELAEVLWGSWGRVYICVVARTMYASTAMRRDAEKRETQLFRGFGACAFISKHFCSFLHCMHIWKFSAFHCIWNLFCMAAFLTVFPVNCKQKISGLHTSLRLFPVMKQLYLLSWYFVSLFFLVCDISNM